MQLAVTTIAGTTIRCSTSIARKIGATFGDGHIGQDVTVRVQSATDAVVQYDGARLIVDGGLPDGAVQLPSGRIFFP